MYYEEDFVEEVRQRSDVVDIISSYVNLKRTGSNYVGLCPFHNEKTASFSVSPSKQMYYCFGCGAGGNVFTFLMEYENFSFPEALKYLAERAGMELPEEELNEEAKRTMDAKARLREMNKLSANYFYYLLHSKRGQKGLAYLKNRGITDETIKRFGLGYADIYNDDLYRFLKSKGYSDEELKDSALVTIDERRGGSDKFWNRVMFPIMDVNNRVIGFGGRVMGDGSPKYLNSKETKLFDKSRNLYGLNAARISRKSNMIICEGYMDVISLHQAGFTQAVASLGTALTPGQAALMKRYTDNVLITYDSDAAGVKAALRAIPILKEAGLTTKVINMQPYKDPDEFIKALGAEAFQERIDKAENSFMYEIGVLEKEYDRTDPAESTKFEREAAAKLVTFREKLERENYMRAVCDRFHIELQGMRELVASLGSKEGILRRNDYPAAPGQQRAAAPKKKKEDGVRQAEKILLTWMIEDAGIFEKVKEYISPQDFVNPLFKDVADKLYAQYESGSLNPAAIISTYDAEETHSEVAAMFSMELDNRLNHNEREKALNDTVLKVKNNSIQYQIDQAADPAQIQQLYTMKNKLSAIHITL